MPGAPAFTQDSAASLPTPWIVPQPTQASDNNGIIVNPSPPTGFTSRPQLAGPVGGTSDAPTQGKQFGEPMDARMFPPVGFAKPMGGPGTSQTGGFDYPAVGQSTTITPGFGALTPSGVGLRDQADNRAGLKGPDPEYHPQVSLGPRKRVAR